MTARLTRRAALMAGTAIAVTAAVPIAANANIPDAREIGFEHKVEALIMILRSDMEVMYGVYLDRQNIADMLIAMLRDVRREPKAVTDERITASIRRINAAKTDPPHGIARRIAMAKGEYRSLAGGAA